MHIDIIFVEKMVRTGIRQDFGAYEVGGGWGKDVGETRTRKRGALAKECCMRM